MLLKNKKYHMKDQMMVPMPLIMMIMILMLLQVLLKLFLLKMKLLMINLIRKVMKILPKKKLILCSLKLRDHVKSTFISTKIIKVVGDGLLTPKKVLFQALWIRKFLQLNLVLVVGFVCTLVKITLVQNYVLLEMSTILKI